MLASLLVRSIESPESAHNHELGVIPAEALAVTKRDSPEQSFFSAGGKTQSFQVQRFRWFVEDVLVILMPNEHCFHPSKPLTGTKKGAGLHEDLNGSLVYNQPFSTVFFPGENSK